MIQSTVVVFMYGYMYGKFVGAPSIMISVVICCLYRRVLALHTADQGHFQLLSDPGSEQRHWFQCSTIVLSKTESKCMMTYLLVE